MLSRLAKSPLAIPDKVEILLDGDIITVKGPLGSLTTTINSAVKLSVENNHVVIAVTEESIFAKAMSGTALAIVKNMITGVVSGFEKKLNVIGVGYKVSANGNTLNMALGYSHPVVYDVPASITVKTPTPTEIIISGCDRALVGQVAADIRSKRKVEYYKGKGIRYSDEEVILKEAKKK